MKLTKLVLILALTMPLHLPAAGDDTPKKEGQYKGVVTEDSIMDKLMTIPGVSKAYEDCKKDHIKLEEIPNCMWEPGRLTADQKKQVQQFYAQEEASKKNKETVTLSAKDEAIDKSNKEAFKTNLSESKYSVKNDYKNDPAVAALSAYFGKKLDEVLNNPEDIKNKKIATVDHTKFINLFTSELGKSVVNAFTSYCMETDPECREIKGQTCIIHSKDKLRELDIKANLDNLKKATFSESEGDLWKNCIRDVSIVCYEKDKIKGSPDDADFKYSQQKACLVMDFVKSARKSLLAADEQKKFYDGLAPSNMANIASNMKNVDNDKKMSADELTQINSSDLDKEFKNSENKNIKISDKNDEVVKEAEECQKQMDQEKCKKFLNTDVTKTKDALVEMGIKQMAQGDELKDKLQDDKNVENYLKEEGYTKEQVAEMMKKENLEEVRKKITERFKAEKEAIIREMADKIDRKSASDDGKITKGDETKISKIKEEMSSRNKDLKDLIHFNNIVASYLTVEEKGTQKKSRNTASLYSEVESYKGNDAKDLQENLKNAKDMKREQNNTELDVKTINSELMNYLKKDSSNGK